MCKNKVLLGASQDLFLKTCSVVLHVDYSFDGANSAKLYFLHGLSGHS